MSERSTGTSPRAPLVSTAGLIRRPVRDDAGDRVGRIADIVVRWDEHDSPLLVGLIIEVLHRRVFVHAADIARLGPRAIRLRSTRFDLRDYVRRDGEWMVNADLMDHQVLDLDGNRVVRACDLYFAAGSRGMELVALDTSMRTLLRRMVPYRPAVRSIPRVSLPWTSVQALGRPGEPIRLRAPHDRLRAMRPADLAAMLDHVAHPDRSALLSSMEPNDAAAVLEEMDPRPVRETIRRLPGSEAADLLSRMAPDEAADALRDLHPHERGHLLEHLHRSRSSELAYLAAASPDTAAGLMTTDIASIRLDQTMERAREIVTGRAWHGDLPALIVVDDAGRLVDDLPLATVIAAGSEAIVRDVLGPPAPSPVPPNADLGTVIDALTANRGTSLVVIDDEGRPLGRIHADDVVDALTRRRPRRWAWQPHRHAR